LQNQLSAPTASVRKAAWASWIGSALEYYDFFLYGIAAVLFLEPLYFPLSTPEHGLLLTISSIGVGYLARPLGAVFLGTIGDLYGRRLVLSITLSLMGLSSVLIGLLPSYHDIGLAAPVLLISLRLLQGFAVGAEHASTNALVLELATDGRRGLFTSFSLSGTQAGLILASIVFFPLSAWMPEPALKSWGWRIPFLLSAVLAFMGLWVRLHLPESLALRLPRSGAGSWRSPLASLLRQYKSRLVLLVLASQVSVVSMIVSVFALSWAVNDMKISRSSMLAAQVASALVSVFTVPAWASLSDRIGRRPVFLFGALMSAVLIWPYLWAISRSDVRLVFLFSLLLMGMAYSAANGVWPALYGELFSAPVRLSGVAIGTQFSLMLAAQAPVLATYLMHGSHQRWQAVALLVTLSCFVSVVAVWTMRETSRLPLDQLG
jgi:MFS family permease